MDISKFLKKYNIDIKDCVIYNMLNTNNPRIDIEELLKDFKKELENEK